MQIVKLQGLAELKHQEIFSNIPDLVQQYLDLKEKKPEGKYFRIRIKKSWRDSSFHGRVLMNELCVEKRIGNLWIQLFATGMMHFYHFDNRKWNLFLLEPAILEESEEKVIYGVRTGENEVKIYCFSKDALELLTVFNLCEPPKECIEFLQTVFVDPEAFRHYIAKNLDDNWHIADKLEAGRGDCKIFSPGGKEVERNEEIKESEVVILLAKHYYHSHCNLIVDLYRFYIWIKGKGIGSTNIYKTEFSCFKNKDIVFEGFLAGRGINSIFFVGSVFTKDLHWKKDINFWIEWEV